MRSHAPAEAVDRAQLATRFYFDRAPGGHCDHCDFGGDAAPTLARAKAKAQEINCINNLRQITSAAIMYQQNTGKSVFTRRAIRMG